ncbi:glutaredoxin domain-containing protein [Eisenbergiella sp.]
MKKTAAVVLIILFFAVAAGFFGLRGTGEKRDNMETEPEKTVIYFFHNNPCESCHEGEKFRELVRDTLAEKQDSIPYWIEEYYIYRPENKEKLNRLMEEQGIPQEDISYPLAIIGDRCLTGYTQMEEELYDSLKAAAEKGSSGAQEAGKTAESQAAAEAMDRENAGAGGSGESYFSWKTQDSIHILLFTTESCGSCEKAKEYLAGLPGKITADGQSYPVELGEISVMEEDNAAYLMELYDFYQVPSASQKVPVVFIGTHYLVGEKQIRDGQLAEYINELEGLGELYLPFGGKPADGELIPGSKADSAAAENGFTGAVSIGSVLLTGLLNGLNPCGLSMTLLFLSLLAAAGGRFLRYGFCFLAGKFTAYLGLGLAVSAAASAIPMEAFGLARNILNVILVCFCLAAALGNIWDFVQIKRGNYGKVRMQLPAGLRRWNEKLLQSAVRPGLGGLLSLAVFGGSVLVSLGEFFCTGQIYLASILRWVQTDAQKGIPVFVFCLYVGAMCIPALLIILLVAGGKSILALSEGSLRRMPAVKLCYAALFVVFAIFSLYMLI